MGSRKFRPFIRDPSTLQPPRTVKGLLILFLCLHISRDTESRQGRKCHFECRLPRHQSVAFNPPPVLSPFLFPTAAVYLEDEALLAAAAATGNAADDGERLVGLVDGGAVLEALRLP